ncbi:hypothetical protein EV178_004371 [Coemansia sp. RSA 1646]|nr:hypothetical protein EV178_004371 [Coemansia sp. RSA 1646]
MDTSKTKRIQVKNACVNCQRACKKCDNERPCLRCTRYNLTETCVDSQRKPRQRGIKRGPYKKRNKQSAVASKTTTSPASIAISNEVTASTATVSDENDREKSPLNMLSDVALKSSSSSSSSPKFPSILSSRIGVFHSRSIPISAARFDTKYTSHQQHQQSIHN